MIEEFVKALEEKERQAALSHEHMVICEEHLAEQITKGVDDCPLGEYKSDMLMRALDTALGNLEIDKATFIKGWSRPLTDNEKAPERKTNRITAEETKKGLKVEVKGELGFAIATSREILKAIAATSHVKTIGFTAALSTIIDTAFDNPEDKKMIATLLYREFGGER